MSSLAYVDGTYFMECIIETVANYLGKSSDEIRPLNFYKKGQMTPANLPVTYCSIEKIWKDLAQSSDYKKRKIEVQNFNEVIGAPFCTSACTVIDIYSSKIAGRSAVFPLSRLSTALQFILAGDFPFTWQCTLRTVQLLLQLEELKWDRDFT